MFDTTMYTYMYVYVYVYIYMYICTHIYLLSLSISVYIYIYTDIYIYIYVYVCVYIYIYIHIHMHICIYVDARAELRRDVPLVQEVHHHRLLREHNLLFCFVCFMCLSFVVGFLFCGSIAITNILLIAVTITRTLLLIIYAQSAY